MRNSRHFFTMLALVLFARAPAAEEIGSRHITMNVSLAARTSLKVSNRVLQFDVTRPDEAATAALEFAAGARMPAGCDVVLTIEPLQAVVGGTATAVTDLRFVGEGTGMLSGSIAADRSTV